MCTSEPVSFIKEEGFPTFVVSSAATISLLTNFDDFYTRFGVVQHCPSQECNKNLLAIYDMENQNIADRLTPRVKPYLYYKLTKFQFVIDHPDLTWQTQTFSKIHVQFSNIFYHIRIFTSSYFPTNEMKSHHLKIF